VSASEGSGLGCAPAFYDVRRARLVLGLVTTTTGGGSTIPVGYLSRPLRPTQPGNPSVGWCNEYWRWFRQSLGRNCDSEMTTLWRFRNQFINKNIHKYEKSFFSRTLFLCSTNYINATHRNLNYSGIGKNTLRYI